MTSPVTFSMNPLLFPGGSENSWLHCWVQAWFWRAPKFEHPLWAVCGFVPMADSWVEDHQHRGIGHHGEKGQAVLGCASWWFEGQVHSSQGLPSYDLCDCDQIWVWRRCCQSRRVDWWDGFYGVGSSLSTYVMGRVSPSQQWLAPRGPCSSQWCGRKGWVCDGRDWCS